MNSGMGQKSPRVVVDTNVLFSGTVFSGKPNLIIRCILLEQITAISSPILLAELAEVLRKKADYPKERMIQIIGRLEELCVIVHPSKNIQACRDPKDNWVLEAAVEGDCVYIITGDKDLLDLKKYKNILILTPSEFLTHLPALIP